MENGDISENVEKPFDKTKNGKMTGVTGVWLYQRGLEFLNCEFFSFLGFFFFFLVCRIGHTNGDKHTQTQQW
jgi:hypothetical protein